MVDPVSGRVTLRLASPEDCRRLWKWRNEQAAREASFNTEHISFEEHVRWFTTKLTDPNTCILIATNADGHEVGYVRFDIVGDEAEISLSIDRAERGNGYGIAAIKKGSHYLLATRPVRRIVAHIKPTNTRSMVAFERAEFVLRGYKRIAGVEACEFVYEGKTSDRSRRIK